MIVRDCREERRKGGRRKEEDRREGGGNMKGLFFSFFLKFPDHGGDHYILGSFLSKDRLH